MGNCRRTCMRAHRYRSLTPTDGEPQTPVNASHILIVTAVIAATLTGGVWVCTRAMRNARKGHPGAAAAGWALLFLGFGIPPPPTPQQQTEDLNREQGSKERSGDGTLPRRG